MLIDVLDILADGSQVLRQVEVPEDYLCTPMQEAAEQQ